MTNSRRQVPTAGEIVHYRQPRKLDSQAVRMLAVLLILILIAGVAIFRLVCIQMFRHGLYKSISDSIHLEVLDMPASRGQILDCRFRPLAGSSETLSFWACSHGLTKSEKSLAKKKLAGFADVPQDKVEEAFGERPRFISLRRFCDEDTALRIQRLNVPGIGSSVEHLRYYTSDCASNIIGFVNAQGEALEGAERYYDGLLSGAPGKLVVNPYVRLQGAPLIQEILKQPTDGHNVVLTIDNTIQFILSEHLRDACEKWNSPLALGVIMDPKTGAILGMSSYPSYSSASYGESYKAQMSKEEVPNYLRDLLEPGGLYKARCLTDLFEPGSLFKIFIVAAALDMNVIRPYEKFFCENGSFRVGRSVISDWRPFGELTVEEILIRSSNIGMSKIGMRLTSTLMHQYLMKFGLLEKPGLGLFAEPVPGLRDLSQWDQEYTCFVSFGQGVAISALALVSAVSAIANDGILMRPYILAAVQSSDGTIIHQTDPTVIRRVIKTSTARTMTAMMHNVVMQGGARVASIPGVAVCGKTGTAQVFDHETGTYSHEDLITSFIGFAPAEDPQVAILISVFSPKHEQREIWGSTVAAPIFSAVAGHVLAYLGSRSRPYLNMANNNDPAEDRS
ncbi:MAG: penicillin-binding protein 2 [Candidatus Coatesbacteria bacterium]|nr:penicillin-binding protein 2 [Candidatus Coatesbacteria bacterium]